MDSKLLSLLRMEKSPAWLCTDWVLAQFSVRKRRAEKLFITFVTEGITQDSPWKKLRGQIFLGDTIFIEKLRNLFSDTIIEIPRSQWFAGRPDLPEILTDEARKTKSERNKAITKAEALGYTLKE
ncbi:MAG: hypothetical protein ACYDHW_16680 [Syntrophorhabdaceae bacterium]